MHRKQVNSQEKVIQINKTNPGPGIRILTLIKFNPEFWFEKKKQKTELVMLE